jgi:hypothetical protein
VEVRQDERFLSLGYIGGIIFGVRVYTVKRKDKNDAFLDQAF